MYETSMATRANQQFAQDSVGPVSAAEIPRELEALNKRVASLGAVVDAMLQRLSPVTQPYPSAPESTKPAPACSSALGCAINEAAQTLAGIDRRLSDGLKALAL